MKKSVLLILLPLFFLACDSTQTGRLDEIKTQLYVLLDSDELLSPNGFDDEGIVDPEYTVGMEDDNGAGRIVADTLWPGQDEYRIRIGRSIESITREIEWEIYEDEGLAYAHIVRTVSGVLNIVAFDTTPTAIDTFSKPFDLVFNQHVRFRQNTDENGGPWIVDAFTLGTGISGNKVSIQNITICDPVSDDSVLYTFNADESENVYIPRDSLPVFMHGDHILVKVTVANTGPEFPFLSGEMVALNYGLNRFMRGRRLLHDNGDPPDSVENDNTFTRIWRIHGPGPDHNRRSFKAWFEVTDFGTFYAEEEAVHTMLWFFPYRVVRR
ncbi:MAG: hypothetical protein ACE5D8_09660 [Fidelibacterota bacterium]